MLLSSKQQNGRKATGPQAENVKDDHFDSRVSGRLKMESENDWPTVLGQHD